MNPAGPIFTCFKEKIERNHATVSEKWHKNNQMQNK